MLKESRTVCPTGYVIRESIRFQAHPLFPTPSTDSFPPPVFPDRKPSPPGKTMKPRIFVSTTTSEFKTARTRIKETLELIGFEVVIQEIFGTEGGDLRQMLRNKIDTCVALVQLAGDCYGAEPPTVDPDYGRVSYTQFEFLYARLQGKKTFFLSAGAECFRDKTPAQLDLDSEHPDPIAHQAELRALQNAYCASIRAEGHLCHYPATDKDLKIAILELRNDSDDLRAQQQAIEKTITTTSRNILALAALLLLLGIGGYLAWQSTQKRFDEIPEQVKQKPLDKSRLREHLTTASEKALAADLAEADAIQGDWEKRQKLTDAANAAHQQRLSRVTELADEFASLETGENASTTLSEMLRILDEQGIDQALAYLTSQSTRLVEKATAKTEAARQDLQPLLIGAQLAIAKGQHDKAEVFFKQLLAPGLPDWPKARHEYIVYLLDNKGPQQQTHETLDALLTTYKEAERQSRYLDLQKEQSSDIENTKNIRWLISFSLEKLGAIAGFRNDHTTEQAAFTASHEIIRQFAADNPDETHWQYELSLSYGNLGRIAIKHGDLSRAKNTYNAQNKILKMLATLKPHNRLWQSSLGSSYERLGEIAMTEKDFSSARSAFAASLEITKKVFPRSPYSTFWEEEVSVSHDRLGDIATEQGDLLAAKEAHTSAMQLRKQIAARHPENPQWQRDLSISHEKLGDIAVAQGDLPAAKAAYTAGLEIRKTLAARDPENTQWQRDLSVSYYNLADIAEREGKAEEARALYKQSHDVLNAIAEKGKHVSPEDKEWLATLKQKAGLE